MLSQDLETFLTKNPALDCNIVSLNVDDQGRKNVFQLRGKLNIKLPQSDKYKMLGFKFVLPQTYPDNAPLVFLDEQERAEVVEMIDYLDKGNRIMFDYLVTWDQDFRASKD